MLKVLILILYVLIRFFPYLTVYFILTIASTFNYDIGLKYYMKLSKLDPDKYNENNCIEKLKECYRTGNGTITIATIIDMACAKGYIHKGSSED